MNNCMGTEQCTTILTHNSCMVFSGAETELQGQTQEYVVLCFKEPVQEQSTI